MSIVSYAQNFEDVMLWRALGHIERGLYVDIGAQHPLVDSVSMAFHQAGWQGVHIEPVPAYADMLRQARPGDTVLQVALGDAAGTLELHVIDDSGLSTAVGEYADQHRDGRGLPSHRIEVPVLTMAAALRHLAGREVHWLKVDVEGFEEQVLRGWDSQLLRPWIMVVEATKPGSPETDFAGWDPLVLAAGYRFVYFDGLNRFYVADEHAELAAAFAAPPNVFDGAQLNGSASAAWCHRVLSQAAEAAQAAEQQASWLRNEWEAARVHAAHAQALLDEQQALQHQLQCALDEQQAQRQIAEQKFLTEAALGVALGEELLAQRARADQAERELAILGSSQLDHRIVNEQTLEALAQKDAHAQAMLEQWTAAECALQAKVAELQHWAHHWHLIAEEREQVRKALLNSTSWRLTAPLRGSRSLVRRSIGLLRRLPHSLRHHGVALARRAVRWAVRTVLANQRLSELARGVLARHPGLKARLRRTTVNADVAERSVAAHSPNHPAQLSERAGRLYLDLRKSAGIKDH